MRYSVNDLMRVLFRKSAVLNTYFTFHKINWETVGPHILAEQQPVFCVGHRDTGCQNSLVVLCRTGPVLCFCCTEINACFPAGSIIFIW